MTGPEHLQAGDKWIKQAEEFAAGGSAANGRTALLTALAHAHYAAANAIAIATSADPPPRGWHSWVRATASDDPADVPLPIAVADTDSRRAEIRRQYAPPQPWEA